MSSKTPVHARTPSFYFWVTVLALAGITLSLYLVSFMRAGEYIDPETQVRHVTTLESMLTEAGQQAEAAVLPEIEGLLLNEVYAPVYAAIPAYADFHFSIIGEYTELVAAVSGAAEAGVQERLYAGFQQRLNDAALQVDASFVDQYQTLLQQQLDAEATSSQTPTALRALTNEAISGAVERAAVTVPMAGVAAGVVGSGALKVVSSKIVSWVAAKFAAKGALKTGSALAGAGTATALCAWSGPIAVVCGVAGGALAWIATDGAIVNLDEYLNRDEFEAELRSIIDADRLATQELLTGMLREKAAELDRLNAESLESFKLRDLNNGQ